MAKVKVRSTQPTIIEENEALADSLLPCGAPNLDGLPAKEAMDLVAATVGTPDPIVAAGQAEFFGGPLSCEEELAILERMQSFVPVSSTIPTAPPIDTQPPTDFWQLTRDGVTQGLLALVALCPEKAAIKMKQGLSSPSKSGALAFGDVFHRALDNVYGLAKAEQGSEYVPEFFITNMDSFVEDAIIQIYQTDRTTLLQSTASPTELIALEVNCSLAKVMLRMYFRHWETDFRELNWVDLERTFRVQYTHQLQPGDPGFGYPFNAPTNTVQFPVRGKFDGVFRSIPTSTSPTGDLWLFETKTKSYIDEQSLSDRLNFELQVMLYLWAMKQTYGETPRGVLYNIVKRPLLRQKVKESLDDFCDRITADVQSRPEEYFVRYNVSVTPDELDEWANRDLQRMMAHLYRWANNPDHTYRNSGACQMWNRPCEYLRLCAYKDTSNLTSREHVFPELDGDLVATVD